MPYQFVKQRLLDLFRHNIEPRIEALHAEQIYQGIFEQQCGQHGIQKLFYPVGASAGYSLMYLLTRVLSELPVHNIIELGSGQTTVLLDRLRPTEGTHVAYEQNNFWARTVAAQAPRCSVEHSPLTPTTHDGVAYDGYSSLKVADFDLLLVDGPNGTAHVSRYDCVPLVAGNGASEFIVIVDDAGRPGEQETVAALAQLFTRKGIDFKLNYLSGRTTQAVMTTPAFRAASYFF